jgi:hypothetical protein
MIGVNTKQIMYLPFDHEFPIQLSKVDMMDIILNVIYQGYVKLTISKCGSSSPNIGYTTDYDDFIKYEFAEEHELNDNLVT